MSHFLIDFGSLSLAQIVKLILKDECSAKGQDQMLQNVNGYFSVQQEQAFLKELFLCANPVHSLVESLHLWSVGKLLVNNCSIFSRLELFPSLLLHSTNLFAIVVLLISH